MKALSTSCSIWNYNGINKFLSSNVPNERIMKKFLNRFNRVPGTEKQPYFPFLSWPLISKSTPNRSLWFLSKIIDWGRYNVLDQFSNVKNKKVERAIVAKNTNVQLSIDILPFFYSMTYWDHTTVVWLVNFLNTQQFQFFKFFKIKEPAIPIFWGKINN